MLDPRAWILRLKMRLRDALWLEGIALNDDDEREQLAAALSLSRQRSEDPSEDDEAEELAAALALSLKLSPPRPAASGGSLSVAADADPSASPVDEAILALQRFQTIMSRGTACSTDGSV